MADVVRVVAADDPLRALFSPAGELTAEGRSRLGLDAAALRELYRNMVLIRRADQEALNLQRQGELGLWGQYLGQEAIHVGAMTALRTTDWVFPSYREFGMAMIRGVAHGPWDPREAPEHRQHVGGVDAADHRHTELAVAGENPVRGPQGRHRPNVNRLLAEVLAPEAKFALPLQVQRLLVGATDQHHLPVELAEGRGIQPQAAPPFRGQLAGW